MNYQVNGQRSVEYTVRHRGTDARGSRRYFTIASVPTERNILLTTHMVASGSSFKRALRKLPIGGAVSAGQVAGDFVLPADRAQKLGFIAGGVGMTPFRSMVQWLLDTRQQRDIVLVYAAHCEADLAFRDVFMAAAAQMNMRVVYVLSGASPPDWRGETGRIRTSLLQQAVPDFVERLWYVSGPELMVARPRQVLRELGVARRQIRRDYFPGFGG
ncbi:MAG: hypothetical protein COT71_00470 [Candidatus Andersenbacteria bacterium CG10_big_fil_rev_8_21_14_0_10_54_11]|uniref:Oxidoreductase FAD/NAD(P)-binding domain-containing protein n=1 Tax=Candidatus Andersenbacteria bacterium CG10_big_fil_rev_8_21_14_0_10_54_11 TaxID=1974485 RepID=A0A2M6X0D9_9BACT|nr:MAG: hypothetical protein COT71_00470 [Candidatus Andersenbacteria bacterium CG10_big_fil_rev_8_21_14_0_10_54_11]